MVLEGSGAPLEAGGLRDQVLVFQYKGKFHAINHVSSPETLPLLILFEYVTDLSWNLGMPTLVLSAIKRRNL